MPACTCAGLVDSVMSRGARLEQGGGLLGDGQFLVGGDHCNRDW